VVASELGDPRHGAESRAGTGMGNYGTAESRMGTGLGNYSMVMLNGGDEDDDGEDVKQDVKQEEEDEEEQEDAQEDGDVVEYFVEDVLTRKMWLMKKKEVMRMTLMKSPKTPSCITPTS
jgi:hypothetical protein